MTGGIYCHDDVSTWSSAERVVAVEGPQVFSGSGISIFWSSGFGIFKQNGGEIQD